MNKIIILQSKQLTESINSGVLDKLYRYALQSKVEDPSYNLTMQLLGNVTPIAAYLDAVDYLTEKFPDLIINEPTKGYYVRFKDSVVESIIFNNLVNVIYPNKYEGVIVSLELNNSGNENLLGFKLNFRNNQDITSFDELSLLVNVKALANEEFRDCHNLESIDLTKIEYLGQNCFRSSYNLEYFNGKNSEIGTLSMPNLKYNGLSKGGAFYCWKDGDVYRGPKIKRILDLGDCTEIGSETFFQNTQLEYVASEVFEKLTKISTSGFNCENLVIEDLKLSNITVIGKQAFKISRVKTISELGVCTIDNYAFLSCSQLTTISDEALANITSLGNGVFENCTNLVVEDLKLPKLTSIGESAFKKTKVKRISDLGIASSVTGFAECTQLTSVVLPSNCNTLGGSAFNGCSNLSLNDIVGLQNILYLWGGALRKLRLDNKIGFYPNVLRMRSDVFTNTHTSLYLPNLTNTKDPNGNYFTYCRNVLDRSNWFENGELWNTIYLKNILEMTGWTLGGTNNDDCPVVWTKGGGGVLPYEGKLEFVNELPQNLYLGNSVYPKIKFLVINRNTPPLYYNMVRRYGGKYHPSFGLYMSDGNTRCLFKYLVVPRSSIELYRQWEGVNTIYSEYELIARYYTMPPENIIAIESMPHFATRAEYDASDITNKDDYLIEEYMGLADGETINWDATPTQYS